MESSQVIMEYRLLQKQFELLVEATNCAHSRLNCLEDNLSALQYKIHMGRTIRSHDSHVFPTVYEEEDTST